MTEKSDRNISVALRLLVLKRDRYTCTYCGVSGQNAELEVDHIHPVSKGGSNHVSNLTTACKKCNLEKRAKTGITPHIAGGAGYIGLYLHTWKEDEQSRPGKRIEYQGRIERIDGEDVFVQLFSWLDGSPTSLVVFPKEFVKSSECTLYVNRRAMVEAYLDHNDCHGEERWYQLRLEGFDVRRDDYCFELDVPKSFFRARPPYLDEVQETKTLIIEQLEKRPMTQTELKGLITNKSGGTISAALGVLLRESQVVKDGKGTKGNPYSYHLVEPE